MKDLSVMTKKELVALFLEQRRKRREYMSAPGMIEKRREYQRKYKCKIREGYRLAKKAGLI